MNINNSNNKLTDEEKKAKLIELLKSKINGQKTYKASLEQEDIWCFEEMFKGSTAYNIYTAVHLEGSLDINLLEKSFNQIVKRHEALRTSFAKEDGVLKQKVREANKCILNINQIDIKKDELDEVIDNIITKPFDIEKDLLLRVDILKIKKYKNILIISTHHIVTDGYSINIILDELVSLYNAYKNNVEPNLPYIKESYGQLIENKEANKESDSIKKQLKYWKEELEGINDFITLPVDKLVPELQTYNGKQKTIAFNVNESKIIDKYIAENNFTLFSVALSTFALILSKYSGQDDIVIGIPVANRNDVSSKSVVGLFVNSIPFRIKINEEENFNYLVEQVKEKFIETLDNQEVSFNEIVKEIKPNRYNNISPIYQVMFVQNVQGKYREIEGVESKGYNLPVSSSKLDITMYVNKAKEGIEATIEYKSDMFEEKSIIRMLDAWKEVTLTMIKNASTSLKNVVLSGQQIEDSRLVNYSKELNDEETLISLFKKVVKEKPNEVAIIQNEKKLTFDELDKLSDNIAKCLINSGVNEEDFVGLCVERSIERVVAMLGILKAGAAYVPIDPKHPLSRIKVIIDEAKIKYVLTTKSLEEEIDIKDISKIIIEDAEKVELNCNLDSCNYSNDKAVYIIFTSGSTGVPKGVIGLQKGIVNRVKWMWEQYPFAEGEVCCHQAAISFVDSVAEVFVPLLKGIPSVVLNQEEINDPYLLIKAINKYNISRIVMTPSLLRVLINGCKDVNDKLQPLKLLNISGETLSRELVNSFFNTFENKTILNIYGSSEVSADCTYFEIKNKINVNLVPIGKPLRNTEIFIVDKNNNILPKGMIGEICVSGDGLAKGYINSDNNNKFIDTFIEDSKYERLYKTGDLGRINSNDLIEYIGRIDKQIKIRGKRIELGEIEASLINIDNITDAAVTVIDNEGEKKLVANIVLQNNKEMYSSDIVNALKNMIPDYMIPSLYKVIDKIPKTVTGKTDYRNLNSVQGNLLKYKKKKNLQVSNMEKELIDIWESLLNISDIEVEDNFFDLGGNSIQLIDLRKILMEKYDVDLSVMDLFRNPNVLQLSKFLRGDTSYKEETSEENTDYINDVDNDIAIIGMSIRVADANTVEEFWGNLQEGICSIKPNTDNYFKELFPDFKESKNHKHINYNSSIANVEYFDADFFDFTPLEARVLDPQQRIFLECAWEAMEDSGYIPGDESLKVGIFAGTTMSTYMMTSLMDKINVSKPNEMFLINMSNSENSIATRAAYKLNVKGPSVSLGTACSTSLTAVNIAKNSLINNECDIAIVGGSTVKVPQNIGYIYEEGSIMSPDGKCKAFDNDANGTVFGNGVSVIILKRLKKALRDRDNIYAVLKGCSINNDGNRKVGYTAPSILGQVEVIKDAIKDAKVDPNSISYIETHGTGTQLGDCIEIEALKEAFAGRDLNNICKIGSVKTSIGHLDAAAGVTGLIKVAMALNKEKIPATLNFTEGNRNISWNSIPFRVADQLIDWKRGSDVRRAGVSSFGIGGANAHAILEEAPLRSESDKENEMNIINLSAKTETALEEMTKKMLKHVKEHEDEKISDIAYTLQTGRKEFNYRWSVVCKDREELMEALEGDNLEHVRIGVKRKTDKPIIFAFPGQGSQFIKMGKRLYDTEKVFKEYMDKCAEIIKKELDIDIKEIIYGEDEELLKRTWITQIALFSTEYSLAQLLMSIGVKPTALIGHSLGQYTAACISGVFTLEEVLVVVANRGKLMETCDEGAMLSVEMSAEEVKDKLKGSLELSVINGENLCVVSGDKEEIDKLSEELEDEFIDTKLLKTSHGFHSAKTEKILMDLKKVLEKVELKEPSIPYLSNYTGEWISEGGATSPEEWIKHTRYSVKFLDNINNLLDRYKDAIVIEVGPGRTLSTLISRSDKWNMDNKTIKLMPKTKNEDKQLRNFFIGISELWNNGINVRFDLLNNGLRNKVSLPTYPFQRQYYWFKPYENYSNANSSLNNSKLNRDIYDYGNNGQEITFKDRPFLDVPYVKPRNNVEENLANTWQELLGIANIGVYDNFFSLGGDSLLATQVSSFINERYLVEINLSDIFDNPTVSGVAKVVEQLINEKIESMSDEEVNKLL
ncbi:MAG: amino acid adenylation domain-containing protein [Clostridium sp.]|nr:amino acid adenylation domain-containing protein [Clostridium sp.]